MLETLIIIGHLLVAIAIVGLVLIQQGKGAEAGASFGSGASATVFGAQGTGTFFSRITAVLTACFFITSLGLAYYAKQKATAGDEFGLPSAAAIQAQEQVQALESELPSLSEDTVTSGQSDDIPEMD